LPPEPGSAGGYDRRADWIGAVSTHNVTRTAGGMAHVADARRDIKPGQYKYYL
jgi:hypothetical protein